MGAEDVIKSAWTYAMRSSDMQRILRQTGKVRVAAHTGLRPYASRASRVRLVNPVFNVVEFTLHGERVVGEYRGEKIELPD